MARTAFFDHPGVIAMAHRGFWAADGVPENSLAAFGAAVALGYRYVETDVHATKDGTLIAFHDDRLDRVTDRTGVVAQLPWSTVRDARMSGTHEIPTLDAILESWPGLRLNLDCKAASAVGPLADAIERHRAHDRVCIASFSDGRRRAVLRRLSRPVATSGGRAVIARFTLGGPLARIPRVASGPGGIGGALPRVARIASGPGRLGGALARVARVASGPGALRGVDCLQVPVTAGPVRVISAASVRRAHRAGVQVHAWTIDESDRMHELLDLGVDGIMTDRADVLRDVLVQRGQWAG